MARAVVDTVKERTPLKSQAANSRDLLQLMSLEAGRMLCLALKDRGLLQTRPFLASVPHQSVSQYGLSRLLKEREVDAWRPELYAEVAQLVEKMLEAADPSTGVRALAPIGMPVRDSVIGRQAAIPWAEYDGVQRVMSDRQGMAITLTAMPADTAVTLWLGWV